MRLVLESSWRGAEMQQGGGGARRGSEGVGIGGIRGHLSCFWHAAWVSNRVGESS